MCWLGWLTMYISFIIFCLFFLFVTKRSMFKFHQMIEDGSITFLIPLMYAYIFFETVIRFMHMRTVVFSCSISTCMWNILHFLVFLALQSISYDTNIVISVLFWLAFHMAYFYPFAFSPFMTLYLACLLLNIAYLSFS
jgi:hypothetical protein